VFLCLKKIFCCKCYKTLLNSLAFKQNKIECLPLASVFNKTTFSIRTLSVRISQHRIENWDSTHCVPFSPFILSFVVLNAGHSAQNTQHKDTQQSLKNWDSTKHHTMWHSLSHYTECHYAECRFAKCQGAYLQLPVTRLTWCQYKKKLFMAAICECS
jgi:hypothetical protein